MLTLLMFAFSFYIHSKEADSPPPILNTKG